MHLDVGGWVDRNDRLWVGHVGVWECWYRLCRKAKCVAEWLRGCAGKGELGLG